MKRECMVPLAIALTITIGITGCGQKTGTFVSDSQTSMLPSHDPTPGLIYSKPARVGIPAPVTFAELQKSNAWYNIDMPEADVGYRWGYMNGHFAMQRTETNAKQWYTLSLPTVLSRTNLAAGNGEMENPNVQIVGASKIYIYAIQPSGEWLICRSDDSGGHWQTHQTQVQNGQGLHLASVSQIGDKDTWVLMRQSNATYRLFHVQKHGASVVEQQVQMGAGHAGLPPDSSTAAVAFTNAKTGWLVATTKAGQLVFYTTVDAGNRWTSRRTIHTPSAISGWRATRVFQPTILENEGVFTAIYTKQDKGRTLDKTVVFRSTDAGAHVIGGVVDKLDDAMANYSGSPTYYTNPDYGYSMNDGRLVRSTDSGASWRTIHSPTLERQLRRYPCVLDIDYVSDPVGYILLGSLDHKQTILLQTTDESRTWSQIGS